MKKLSIKTGLFTLIVILVSLLGIGCTDNTDETAITATDGIISFTLKVENKGYQAVLHPDTQEATIGGIAYSSTITGAVCKLTPGTSISPDPSTRIKAWGPEEVFMITQADGTSKEYKVILNDFLAYAPEQPKSPGCVIGYIMADEYENMKAMIRWEYLTHINVSFLYVHEDGSMDDSTVRPCIDAIVKTAHEYGVKVLVSLQSDSQEGFAKAVRVPATRTRLVTDAIAFAHNNGLDGIDIDYELYGSIGPDVHSFVSELYARKGAELMQTCAVAQWNAGYTAEWHHSFDLINLMTYDNTGSWAAEGQHSSYEQMLDGVRFWNTTLQAPLEKLVVGLPFYGYTWDILPGLTTPTAVRYSQIFGFYPDMDVANLDQVGRTYYNGCPTIARKCRYAKETGLAGVMIWQLFQDTTDPAISLMEVIGQEMKAEARVSCTVL